MQPNEEDTLGTRVDPTQPVPVAHHRAWRSLCSPGPGDLARYWANIRDRRDGDRRRPGVALAG